MRGKCTGAQAPFVLLVDAPFRLTVAALQSYDFDLDRGAAFVVRERAVVNWPYASPAAGWASAPARGPDCASKS